MPTAPTGQPVTVRASWAVVLALLVAQVAVAIPAGQAGAARISHPPARSCPRAQSAAAAEDEEAFVDDINHLRAGQGLRALDPDATLVCKARRWAATMAAAGRIWHSRLPDGVPGSWQRLGENVGMGASERSLQTAFIASPRHFRNFVDPAFQTVGIGVTRADGIVFVSQVFMRAAPRRGRKARQQVTDPEATLGTAGAPLRLRRARPTLGPRMVVRLFAVALLAT